MSDDDLPPTAPAPASGLATVALVCGIAGVCLFFLPPVALTALVLGIIALSKGQAKRRAITGIALGAFGLLLFAAMAIPSLIEDKVAVKELTAGAALKSGIFYAETQFQTRAYQDADADQVGEYGLLSELSGRRATMTTPAGKLGLLPSALAKGDASGGYHFAIFLPDGKDGAISEPDGDPAKPRPASVDAARADAQEKSWVAYAWPDSPDSGRMFAICRDGKLYCLPWDGKAPTWNSLFGGGGFDATPIWPVYVHQP